MFIDDIISGNFNKYSKYEFRKLYKEHFNEIKEINFFKDIFEKIRTDESKSIFKYLNDEYHKCLNCDNLAIRKFCCHQCACDYNNSHRTLEMKMKMIEKRKQTNLRKYGCEYPQQSEIVKSKMKQTNLERYGCEYTTQSEQMKQKAKQTNLKKYGCENARQSEIVSQKIKQTNLKKYGCEYGFQSSEIKEKIKQTNLEKYGIENITYKNFKNLDLYNEEYIKNNFVKNGLFLAKEFSEFYNCSFENGIKFKKRFGISEHSKIESTNLKGYSETEKELVKFIKSLTDKQVIENDRNLLNPLELDIVLPDFKLAIEYDGIYWHSNIFKERDYHLNKTKKCLEKGYTLFTIFDSDDLDIWKSIISNKLGLNEKIYARKCIIKELEYKEVKDFLIENHLQCACPSKINLGLFYNEELVEVMTFGKSRFNKKYDYELLRLCTKKYFNVIGGVSKLFKYFTRKYKGSIISYANRRFSNGNIYKQLGLEFINETTPNYFYLVNHKLESRIKFQKHKLKNILSNFDEKLTEQENMSNNGFKWIYDCGNFTFGTGKMCEIEDRMSM